MNLFWGVRSALGLKARQTLSAVGNRAHSPPVLRVARPVLRARRSHAPIFAEMTKWQRDVAQQLPKSGSRRVPVFVPAALARAQKGKRKALWAAAEIEMMRSAA